MGLLNAFLKPYQEKRASAGKDASLSNEFVEKVENGASTKATNPQRTVISSKNVCALPKNETTRPEEPIFSNLKNKPDPKGLRENKKNVEEVACVRENESSIFRYFLKRRILHPPSLVGSLARASNILNKLADCDSCPACGHWDGYGPMRRGRYCFYSAYFKAKPARPVPIAEAKGACPKNFDPDPARF